MTESGTEPGRAEPRVVGLTDRPRRAGALHSVELDGETVVYDETREALHLLDVTATVIWSLLDGEATVSEICVDLAEAYATDLARVEADVCAMLGQLADNGLIEVAGS